MQLPSSISSKLQGFIFLFCILILGAVDGASQVVKVQNGSFEGDIRMGGSRSYFALKGWHDCGRIRFPRETPPDIHPSNFWTSDKTGKGIDLAPSADKTYLGLVVRKNDTYESVSQQLDDWLKADQCYVFSVDLVRSLNYWSNVAGQKVGDNAKYNFSQPIVLRVWGSNSVCYADPAYGTPELLAESLPVKNTKWMTQIFTIKPKKDYRYITLEAFYIVPMEETYLGHVLVDNASDFVPIDCNDDEAIMEFFEEREEINRVNKKDIEEKKAAIVAEDNKEVEGKKKEEATLEVPRADREVAVAKPRKDDSLKPKEKPKTPPKKQTKIRRDPKILTELSSQKLEIGQKLKIEKLYFVQNSTDLKDGSDEVLEELADFLKDNETVRIEIGGHTNGIPKHDYCDSLSLERAKSIADYLADRGVSQEALEYKGYGKRDPVASNKSVAGRALNQRVEITILQI